MKAIQVKQTGGPEALEYGDVPVPEPKPNETVVKIAAAGVNFIDVYQREGRYKLPLPFTAGQEGAGVVSAVGTEVKSFKLGDRVAFCGVQGSDAEYAAVPGDRLVQIPQGVNEREAAAAILQGMTAHYLLHDTCPLKRGPDAHGCFLYGAIFPDMRSTARQHAAFEELKRKALATGFVESVDYDTAEVDVAFADLDTHGMPVPTRSFSIPKQISKPRPNGSPEARAWTLFTILWAKRHLRRA